LGADSVILGSKRAALEREWTSARGTKTLQMAIYRTTGSVPPDEPRRRGQRMTSGQSREREWPAKRAAAAM
jgi:hypothetical protein